MSNFFAIFEQNESSFSYGSRSLMNSPVLEHGEANPLGSLDFDLFINDEREEEVEHRFQEERGEYEGELFGCFGMDHIFEIESKQKEDSQFEMCMIPRKLAKQALNQNIKKNVRLQSLSTSACSITEEETLSESFTNDIEKTQKKLSNFPEFEIGLSNCRGKPNSSLNLKDIKSTMTFSKDCNLGLLDEALTLKKALSNLRDEFKISQSKRRYVRKAPYRKRSQL